MRFMLDERIVGGDECLVIEWNWWCGCLYQQ